MAGKQLHIKNIPFSLRDNDLRNFFGTVGPIERVFIPLDNLYGRSRGFGFVTYVNPNDAANALRRFQKSSLGGRQITLSYAHADNPAVDSRKRNRDEISQEQSRVDREVKRVRHGTVQQHVQPRHFDRTEPSTDANVQHASFEEALTANDSAYRFDPKSHHVDRPELLSALHKYVLGHQFTLLSSPRGTGKTSLVKMYRTKYQLKFLDVNFHCPDDPYKMLIDRAGLDIKQSKVTDNGPLHELLLKKEKSIVIIIDDAQDKYDQQFFWSHLVKGVDFLPPQVRFILCATRTLTVSSESPVNLAEFKFQPSLLFSRDEAMQLIRLPEPTGLRSGLNAQTVCNVIIKECSGVVGLLRLSITALNEYFFADSRPPSTAEILQRYFSDHVTESFHRCFGKITKGAYQPQINTLLQMFTQAVRFPAREIADESLFALEKCGILKSPEQGVVEFSSPAAMRYISLALFPTRSAKRAPSTLVDLVCAAVSHMSASALRSAGVLGQNAKEAAKEALFQHNILAGLYAETPASCAILTELSWSFGGEKIYDELDYFINGTLCWGLELLVHGRGRQDHVERFSSRGKYAPLGCRDYLVVDFRVGEKSPRAKFESPKLMTVYFEENYSTCEVFVGGVSSGCLELRY